jgi:hypothetical protein
MPEPLLPRRADNAYGGRKAALWLFALLLLMRSGMGVNVLFNGRTVAISADGFPLDAYGPAGARAFVALFAIWGWAQLMVCLLGVVVLVRYRALVPLMFALFLLEQAGRRLILRALPIERVGNPPGVWVNAALLVVTAAGLALSLWSRSKNPARE